MRVLDLFSGIGGFSLGLERAGMETVAFCEFDKKAQLVLKKHWSGVPIYDDVRTLTGKRIAKEIGTIDLICGGFPCQPFSVAGKQRGDQDDRHLWPEYFRLIQEIRPRWVIAENVTGLIQLGLDQVLSDLEGEDYSTETVVIPASAVNAPHRRDRLWIMAHSIGRGRGDSKDRKICRNGLSDTPIYSSIHEDVADTECQRQQGQGKYERPCNTKTDKTWETDRAVSGSKSREGNWNTEPELGRVAHGVPNRMDRLKQLGNAVVPQVVEVIGRAIMQIERSQDARQNF